MTSEQNLLTAGSGNGTENGEQKAGRAGTHGPGGLVSVQSKPPGRWGTAAAGAGDLPGLSSHNKVYSVIYDSGSVFLEEPSSLLVRPHQYSSNGLRKSNPPQNRQLIVLISQNNKLMIFGGI